MNAVDRDAPGSMAGSERVCEAPPGETVSVTVTPSAVPPSFRTLAEKSPLSPRSTSLGPERSATTNSAGSAIAKSASVDPLAGSDSVRLAFA